MKFTFKLVHFTINVSGVVVWLRCPRCGWCYARLVCSVVVCCPAMCYVWASVTVEYCRWVRVLLVDLMGMRNSLLNEFREDWVPLGHLGLVPASFHPSYQVCCTSPIGQITCRRSMTGLPHLLTADWVSTEVDLFFLPCSVAWLGPRRNWIFRVEGLGLWGSELICRISMGFASSSSYLCANIGMGTVVHPPDHCYPCKGNLDIL
jgi:hypothetical protein